MYKETRFADCDIEDPFFDSLKIDYPEFCTWFGKKSAAGATAFVSKGDDGHIQAFVYVKEEENEAVVHQIESRLAVSHITHTDRRHLACIHLVENSLRSTVARRTPADNAADIIIFS